MRALREPVAAHSSDHGGVGFEDDAKQSHSALVNRETTRGDRTSLLSTRTREHDDAGHATAESPLGMLDVQHNIRAHRCAPSGPGEFRGCGREHGSHWGGRDPVPPEAQGQLKCVDQKTCLQLIYETGQRPENQITALGLVSRQKDGIERTSYGVFLRSCAGSQLDGARIPTDEVRRSSGALGHCKEYRCNEPKSDTAMRESVSEER